MIKISIKPLSVNEAWQGRRFKTEKYIRYERDVLFLLPKIKLPDPPYKISYEFGLSNTLSDIDNPVKPITDILQKKYGLNDRDIYEAHLIKVITLKGEEYIKFNIETYKL